jgi:sulfotransferase
VKQYFFLSGIHRSGNTLLSGILNQNPDLYVSPLSPLSEYLWSCHANNCQPAITYPKKENIKNMISKMIENLHDVKQPVVFDRSKTWIFPDNVNLIKQYINPNPKIIYTTRPLEECVASSIKSMKSYLYYNMQNEIRNKNFLYNDEISENDNIAEYLLQFFYIPSLNFANTSINDPANKDLIYIIKYDELIYNPKITLDNLYNFLGLDLFDHDLKNITIKEKDLDHLVGIPENVHKIEKQLIQNKINVSNFISEKMIDRCSLISSNYRVW